MVESLEPDFAGTLGKGHPTDWRGVDTQFDRARILAARNTETSLGNAGWYDNSAAPYPEPTTSIDAPPPQRNPVVAAVRQLWLARFNPSSPRWFDDEAGESGSDVIDETYFPWNHPEAAVEDGNFWLSTTGTPSNRIAINSVNVGDLVIVQRSDPVEQPHLRKGHGATSVLVGIAIAFSSEEWDDVGTGQRERRISLLPAASFKWPVPRTVARSKNRLRGNSFAKMPQNVDGSGPMGFTLSAVVGDTDTNDLLAVCGIHPDALAEPDIARLAARLRATAKGNRPYWRQRWDHVYRHSIRTRHEQLAVASCRSWAKTNGYMYRASAEYTANAGFDLLFADAAGVELQVEVKGYSTSKLSGVHLQKSQAARAQEAAGGVPPAWKLYALLKVDSANPTERILTPEQVVARIAAGGLQVR